MKKVILYFATVLLASCGSDYPIGNSGITNNAPGGGGTATPQQIMDRTVVTPCDGSNRRFHMIPVSWSSSTTGVFKQKYIQYADASTCSALDSTGSSTISDQNYDFTFEDLDASSVASVKAGQFMIIRTALVGGGSPVDVVSWYQSSTSKICEKQIALGDSSANVLSGETAFLQDPEANAIFCLTKI